MTTSTLLEVVILGGYAILAGQVVKITMAYMNMTLAMALPIHFEKRNK